MLKKAVIFLILINILVGAGVAQELSRKENTRSKAQIVKLQKEVARLKKKLAKTKLKRIRTEILDKIDLYQIQMGKLKKQLLPKAAEKPARRVSATAEAIATVEAAPEEIGALLEVEEKPKRAARHEVGGVTGVFAGATIFMGEVRFPLKFIFGPATTSVRLSTGLAQSRETDRRYIPLNLDLIFNFPPGWFTGVENYLGAGLNYILLTSESKQGTVGGEVFYGVQSEGFGGMLFGELGYAYLRTGFAGTHKGVSVLIGYRKTWGF